MRSVTLSCMLAAILFSACIKEKNRPFFPAALKGQWKRGVFNMSLFHSYAGDTLMHAYNSSDAIDIKADGTARIYTMFFPTHSNGGCTPQKFMELAGHFSVDTLARSMSFTPLSGYYREMFQSCAGMQNVSRTMTTTELNEKKMTYYYRTGRQDGIDYLHISYSSSQAPGIHLVRTAW
ncbi:MAG TPA: hypothetical protein VFR58_13095 [Flavisolibacter sp.]|nr:hypothetical protein [Flavisolibacter sp.]